MDVNLSIYDLSGRLVKNFYSGAQDKGSHTVNIKEDEFAKGIYFVKFSAGTHKETRKLVLIR